MERSKSDVAMNAWPPQASYPCGNFSDTSSCKQLQDMGYPTSLTKGSLGHAFAANVSTENRSSSKLLALSSTVGF